MRVTVGFAWVSGRFRRRPRAVEASELRAARPGAPVWRTDHPDGGLGEDEQGMEAGDLDPLALK